MSVEEEMDLDEEDGDDDGGDPPARVSHGSFKRRKQSLDEEETQLAANLGSDLPAWDDTLVSAGFSADTPSPSPTLPLLILRRLAGVISVRVSSPTCVKMLLILSCLHSSRSFENWPWG
jgi:hypothetical protein